MDVNGLGAEYIVTLTIKSDDIKTRGDIVLTQTVYVKEECVAFNYAEPYHVTNYDNKADLKDCIVTKGQLINGNWQLALAVSEHFEITSDKKTIF